MVEHVTLPEWLPFACLITGKITRKPMFTRLFESLFLGAVSAGLTMWVGVKLLEKDVTVERARLDSHLIKYEAQIVKRDAELARGRIEWRADIDKIINKIDRLEDCIRLRTCTR